MDVICRQLSENLPAEETGSLTQEDEIIVCAACNHHITDLSRQIIVNNSFHHIFANPHGHVFEIGCFSDARGCRSSSMSSYEFSWFPGYSWQISVCNYCSTHLGWVFSSDSRRFYGLILEKLIFP